MKVGNHVGAVYKHFKGGLYTFEGIVNHAETGEGMVLYRSLKTRELWVRPLKDFYGNKDTENGRVRRFSRVEI